MFLSNVVSAPPRAPGNFTLNISCADGESPGPFFFNFGTHHSHHSSRERSRSQPKSQRVCLTTDRIQDDPPTENVAEEVAGSEVPAPLLLAEQPETLPVNEGRVHVAEEVAGSEVAAPPLLAELPETLPVNEGRRVRVAEDEGRRVRVAEEVAGSEVPVPLLAELPETLPANEGGAHVPQDVSGDVASSERLPALVAAD